MKKNALYLLLFVIAITLNSHAQEKPLSQQMAATVMELWKDSMKIKNDGKPTPWSYEQGVALEGFDILWKNTADATYFDYVKRSMDFFVKADGSIRRFKTNEYNIDNVKNGRSLIMLYQVTNDYKYYKAASILRDQLKTHPRTSEGGFWHKNIYPHQMWLDGLYMAEPFYAEYAAAFNEPEAFDDIANQFILMEKHARDPKTGLLYHGWDESKGMKWADDKTGCSPNFWGRAMGWYAMALVDVLDNFPEKHPKRDSLIAILNRLAEAVAKVQDAKTGLWFEVLDMPVEKGNYPEASASCMFTYAFAKGARKGYLSKAYSDLAQKAYEGIKKEFVEKRSEGKINLKGTVSVAGLGGRSYRDGSYAYYLSEPVVTNDPKGVGAFILAANEMEMIPTVALGKGKTVLLDNYFNHETKKDSTGFTFDHHYVWNEQELNGFTFFGHVFNKYGVKTTQSKEEPTAALLSKADIYIIVDPDNSKETPKPNLMQEKDAKVIYDWVKKGGVLLMFANDTGHAEIPNFNKLATKFGIRYRNESINMLQGKEYEKGAVIINPGNEIFISAKKIYAKEVAPIQVKAPAKAILTKNNDVVVAVAKIGKGTVFAIGDPWLYNEYIDDRKISSKEYENYKAAEDLVNWAIKQLPKK
jgi:unsaturated rhamnogalacturonyl hydrolase